MMPRVSIIIATFDHAAYVRDAIESALAQTEPCEVLVVDDGSTDDTAGVLASFGDLIRVVTQAHAGPSAARNAGLEAATGAFVMFLDADDVLAPTKVAAQLAAFDDHVGWVLCDVRIEDDVRKIVETASTRYRYAHRNLGGWIRSQLAASNFIPIMAPLVRRSTIGDIRFSETLRPEDWHFWYAIAGQARVRYLPRVLATYRKRRGGRNTQVVPQDPPTDGPLLLNLGCGTPGARSWHPIAGCVNLDRSMGWMFEDGLPQYEDASVDGITVSHALMYVADADWPAFVLECRRVLTPHGVLRITEDDTTHPGSGRRGGWRGSEPAVTLTDAAYVRAHLERWGFDVFDVGPRETRYRDHTLVQQQHGDPPDVFFLEAVKPPMVLFAPHADDEALFASYQILRYGPAVTLCYPSAGDYGDTAVRLNETKAAVRHLGGAPVTQWHGGDLVTQMRALDAQMSPVRVFAPAVRASHPDHVAVALAARAVFGDRVTTYHTYDAAGKVRDGVPVRVEPSWEDRKRSALACYVTQRTHPRARVFFDDDLDEYVAVAS